MNKIDIKNLSKAELEEALEEIGAEPYRAKQIFRWLYKVGVKSFDEMTDLSEELRKKLHAKFHLGRLTMLDSRSSRIDGTTKYLLKLEDANTVETVFLPEARRATICLSSQVGCKYGCTFCASASFGFVRSLKASEILDEALFVRSKNPSVPITNLVFMGIGEPFDNYDNVLAAIRVLNDEDAFRIGARKITISTCGVIPGMKRLEGEGLQVELSISLHAPSDEVRSKLVPINKKYPLKELMDSCRAYTARTDRIITFEYVLIKGVNSSAADALKLAQLVKGMKCKVNTISYNQIVVKDYKKPTAEDVKIFMHTLKEHGVTALHRKSKGEDIDAGCGQLRISRM